MIETIVGCSIGSAIIAIVKRLLKKLSIQAVEDIQEEVKRDLSDNK